MMKFSCILLFCIILISCNNQPENNYEKLILGEWKILVKKPVLDTTRSIPPPPPPLRNNLLVGYEFKENGVYEYKLGFFKKEKNTQKSVYLGTTSKFKI
ncbi:hypothetical protein SAMN06265349_103257 [Flavobacterium resistens]|uniref:Lipocalin-like domain-containing protein n=1 Tax=Flavobacterium resistens TaxID=443612 RepID=A0A521DJD6_9FLAO|nr:hypothetical protein [Flavobacterium resistens]MRX68716.1 hypothetical protein [Flavobacterium resistens]SMO71030.1 hypothetical protein SAMN06265349_103257 [Flavobacterium resistens]